MLGLYLAVALPEEMFFRGILQNLLRESLRQPWLARIAAAAVFGCSHLGNRGFPNWRYTLVAGVAGWFYGRAYDQERSVVAAAVVHALVILTWRVFFE
jgi:membrane protease YdiL (CAAX protease family)